MALEALENLLEENRGGVWFLAHRAEILPPHCRFVVARLARDGRAIAGGWLVEKARGG